MTEAREFLRRITMMRSPHALRQARRFAQEAARSGYGDEPLLRVFRNVLATP